MAGAGIKFPSVGLTKSDIEPYIVILGWFRSSLRNLFLFVFAVPADT